MKKENYITPAAESLQLEIEHNCLVVGSAGNNGEAGQIGEGGNYGF